MSTTRSPLTPSQRSQIDQIPGNDRCNDCGTSHPTWCSLGFGILVCLDCSGRHRGMGTHITLVQSLDLDSLTAVQVETLLQGGNETFQDCVQYQQPVNATTTPPDAIRAKYTSAMALLYKLGLQARVAGQVPPTELPDRMQSWVYGAASKKPARSSLTCHNTHRGPSWFVAYSGALRYLGSSGRSVVVVVAGGMLGLATVVGLVPSTSSSSLSSWIRTTPLGVGMLGAAVVVVAGVIVTPSYMAWKFQSNRLPALETAVSDLDRRIRQGRAKSTPHYVVLFPPNCSIGDSVSQALLFYPDALVDHVSYAKSLGTLSDWGLLVVLVIAEPLRMPCPTLGYDATHAQRMLKEIETMWGMCVDAWSLGGHGLGADTAATVVLDITQSGQSVQTSIVSCILWDPSLSFPNPEMQRTMAAAPSGSALSKLRFLTVNAVDVSDATNTNSHATISSNNERHPCYSVLGGNHAGFAHHQGSKDGNTRRISLDEQHRQLVQSTAAFLNLDTTTQNSSNSGGTTAADSKKND